MIIEILFVIVIILIVILNVVYRNVAKTAKETNNGIKISGFEIARKLSSHFCEEEPHIIKKSGKNLDYYDKDRNVIKLSPEVFDGEDIYAAATAVNVALETKEERKKVSIGRKINSILVIGSYIVIIIGAFANNTLVIHLGMVLFILTFILEFLLLGILLGTEEELDELYELIKQEKLIKPIEEYKENAILLNIARIVTLPYNFINYFR